MVWQETANSRLHSRKRYAGRARKQVTYLGKDGNAGQQVCLYNSISYANAVSCKPTEIRFRHHFWFSKILNGRVWFEVCNSFSSLFLWSHYNSFNLSITSFWEYRESKPVPRSVDYIICEFFSYLRYRSTVVITTSFPPYPYRGRPWNVRRWNQWVGAKRPQRITGRASWHVFATHQ